MQKCKLTLYLSQINSEAVRKWMLKSQLGSAVVQTMKRGAAPLPYHLHIPEN